MTANNGETNNQHNGDETDRPPQHSQTLPMITEEIAASRSEPAQSVTTPVMPPNPIRREAVTEPRPAAEAAPTPQPAAEEAPTPQPAAEEEKKSEGRISATQLIAGAGAAATSSVIGGQLGVAGTVVGAGVASVITGLAVTLYGRSLDKGKEKVKQVGSKLAPAVKAQIAKGGPATSGAARASALAKPRPQDASHAQPRPQEQEQEQAEDGSRTWWQKLRRKRVLYPVTIGVAVFGIGLGAVVMAESFTEVDISPGTSQISRSVTGNSGSGEESGTDAGSNGSADSGSSGSASGSQPGTDSSTGTTDEGSTSATGESAGETGSEGTTTGTRPDQGTDTSAGTSDASGQGTSEGTGGSSDSTSSGTTSGSGSSEGAGSSANGGSGGGSTSSGGSGADAAGGSGIQD